MTQRRIVFRHALKNALTPVVSYLGPATAAIVTGSVVIEQIFGIPGLGRYFVQGALNRDYTLVMGVVVTYGALIIVLNLAVDLLYGVLDPRVRHDWTRPWTPKRRPSAAGRSPWHAAAAHLGRNRAAMTGLATLGVLAILSVAVPMLSPYPIDEIFWDAIGTGPSLSGGHLFGTDANGRDLLLRTLYAGRISLAVGTGGRRW